MTTSAYVVTEVDYVDGRCRCSSCSWSGPATKTGEIGECALTPGDPSPCGRCPRPDCESLCYLDAPVYKKPVGARMPDGTVRAWKPRLKGATPLYEY